MSCYPATSAKKPTETSEAAPGRGFFSCPLSSFSNHRGPAFTRRITRYRRLLWIVPGDCHACFHCELAKDGKPCSIFLCLGHHETRFHSAACRARGVSIIRACPAHTAIRGGVAQGARSECPGRARRDAGHAWPTV